MKATKQQLVEEILIYVKDMLEIDYVLEEYLCEKLDVDQEELKELVKEI